MPNAAGWTVVGGRSHGMEVPDLPADIWSAKWEFTNEKIPMKDPIYGRQLYLDVCVLRSETGPAAFAVREVSNGVYLFAVPRVL